MKFLPIVDRLGEIRRLYFATTRATIEADFEKALELLKGMESEEERSRATVFMHGLAQMKADWGPPGQQKRSDREGMPAASSPGRFSPGPTLRRRAGAEAPRLGRGLGHAVQPQRIAAYTAAPASASSRMPTTS